MYICIYTYTHNCIHEYIYIQIFVVYQIKMMHESLATKCEICTSLPRTTLVVCALRYIYTYIFTYKYMYIYTYIYLWIHVHIYIHILIYACRRIYMRL